MINWLIFFLFLKTKPSFSPLLPGPCWTFLLLRTQSLRYLKVIQLNYCWDFKISKWTRTFKLLNLCGKQLISIPMLLMNFE
jgi:hypothetical protein